MKKQFIKTSFLLLCVLLVSVAGGMFMIGKRMEAGMGAENGIVLLNEIEQLTTGEGGENPAKDKIRGLEEVLRQETRQSRVSAFWQSGALFLIVSVLCLAFALFFLYRKIVVPFHKMEKYAEQIAKGDMEIGLAYERTNFFGAFTWAFDHMRKEIAIARRNEAEAVSENKTIIATLSHDIKTPLASIRAYAEGLEANLGAEFESRERYLQVIMRKCDEVSRLVNDLTLHSLSELERLEIRTHHVNVREALTETLRDLEYTNISLREPLPDVFVLIDEKRMAQVILNLLENARKYAPGSKIEIWALAGEERCEIHIRDYGRGILPEDMPFVTQKFYRGKNVKEQQGSGLGLYIVSYIMERMNGGMALINHSNGLEVMLWLPVAQD